MRLSVHELVDIAHMYYPRLGDAYYRLPAEECDRLREQSPEWQALDALKQERMRNDEAWREFFTAFREAVPEHLVYRIPAPGHDICYTASVYLGTVPWPGKPGGPLHRHLHVCMSFLAPLYLIYESFALEHVSRLGRSKTPLCHYVPCSDELMPAVEWVERELMARFGCERIDIREARVQIPQIEVGLLPPNHASILDAFFGDDRIDMNKIIQNPPPPAMADEEDEEGEAGQEGTASYEQAAEPE